MEVKVSGGRGSEQWILIKVSCAGIAAFYDGIGGCFTAGKHFYCRSGIGPENAIIDGNRRSAGYTDSGAVHAGRIDNKGCVIQVRTGKTVHIHSSAMGGTVIIKKDIFQNRTRAVINEHSASVCAAAVANG